VIKINKVFWGGVKVDGQDYHQVIIYGGKVEERDRDKLESIFGTTHRIGEWEIRKLKEGSPEVIMVASGFDGVLKVSDEDKKKFGEVDLRVLKSEEAIREYNRLVEEGKKVNILVHTTC
jgi:hypothetical protein